MSTAAPEAPAEIEIGDVPYQMTADKFFHLVEAGFFPEEARVYLRDGRIYEKMSKTNAHTGLGTHIQVTLTRRLPPEWVAFPEGQFRLARQDSFLPDVAVIRCEDARTFAEQGRRPQARDIALVVEVAMTSLAKDLGPNLERYARNGIPNYWVADIVGRRLFVHTDPRIVEGRGEYGRVEIVKPGDSFTLILDGREVARFSHEDLMYRTVPPPEPAE